MVTTGLATPVTTQERAELYGGVAYLLLTLCGTVCGYETFLIDVVNTKLSASGHVPLVDLFSADAAVPKDYSTIIVQADFAAACSRHVLFSELIILPRALQDLRNTSKAARVYAHYCWLDLDRHCDIAHTSGRSTRFWPTCEAWWDVTVVTTLSQTLAGHQSFNDSPTYAMQIPIADEVTFVTFKDLKRYDLTWQNQLIVGITETIDVKNALGIRQRLPIKSLPVVYGTWTSLVLFWNFLNDMYTCYCFNASLIRGLDNDFDMIGLPIEDAYGMQDTEGNFVDQVDAFRRDLGHIGSLDALVTPFPPAFACGDADLLCAGSNLLCQYNAPALFPQKRLSYYDNCGSQSQFRIVATNQALVFALFASGATDIYSI
ncbi:hypothetical protein DYB25_014234 [Aphanomyces astaci]|nr:hypothetical protein DYB36_013463 [Aphanomyces astaci]RHY35812.1 hypothetical protein DYB25_014234 [Aphanomyces astaci]RHY40279.1 hypothetical protein DYB34_011602 [Aphanomyces astaci]RHZ28778.1 hypothetical protein DYB31_003588 [Aphanomyces astaci]RHZ29857.1 hypothetical protein DYB26_005641 [Aphanomyces astaci]